MKKKLLSLIAFALALVMAMSALPAGAAVHFEGKETLRADDAASVEHDICEEPDNAECFAEQPKFIPPAPPGYNSNDFTKIVTFLEQTDENGIKNGKKLNPEYNPLDMETWGDPSYDSDYFGYGYCEQFAWEPVNGVLRIVQVDTWNDAEVLHGTLDLSGCSALKVVEINGTISAAYLQNCSSLEELFGYSERLATLDLKNCSSLKFIKIDQCCRLKELDVSDSPKLETLSCSNLDLLDVSNNERLTNISGGFVKEIRCKNNVVVKTEGSGYVQPLSSVRMESHERYDMPYVSDEDIVFYGWYNKENGQCLSSLPYIDVNYYSDVEITARFNLLHFQYDSSITGETEEYDLYYSDDFFSGSSFEYNRELVLTSIKMSMAAASTESDNIEFMLRGLGFRDGLQLNYPKPTEDTIGFAIGSKNATLNDQEVSIIAVAVRGGGYGQEWGDNGRLGSGKEHEGFSRAANTVYNAITSFVQENASSLNPKIKVWIAGYSRAGAVANIAAHRLSTDGIGRENFNASDVYAFCFECPNTNMGSVVNVPRSNIRNFVNPIDVVPMVPLTDWGYGRYGKTLYFPYKGSTGYSDAKANMKQAYQWIIDCFIDHETGEYYYNSGVCPYNPADYTKEGSNQRASFVEFFRRASRIVSKQDYLNNQSSIIWLLKNTLGGSKSERALLPSINVAQLFRNILLTCGIIGDGVSAASFYENASEYLLISHYPELCLAWIESIDAWDDSDYSKLRYTRLGVDYYWNNGSKSGENPASIDIYRGNTKVASFKDGAFVLSDESISAYIDYDGQIVFILPDYNTYRAEFGSTSNAQLSVTMSKCLGESAAVEQVVAYVDLPVNSGDKIGGNIDYLDYEESYSLNFNNTAVEPDVQQGELNGNALTHNVEITIEGDGVVYGGGLYAPGEYALLSVADGEESFEGWYLNGELISTELEYRFMVTEDIAYTASFGAASDPTPTPTPTPTAAPITPNPDEPQIIVDTKTVLANSTVTVDVSLLNNPGIVSMALTVDFDERLELVSVTDSGLIPGQVHSPTMGNPYVLCWVNDTATENFTGNGAIATLTFEVPEDMPVGEYPITVSYDLDNYDIYNCDVELVEFAVVNGRVNVIDVLIGDVNTDTKVNALDRLYLTRFLAKWADYPEAVINMIAADVNVDTKVNALDRLILTRYLAKWAGYETLPYSAKSAPEAKKAETKGGEPTIVVDSVTAEPGETVTVCVSLENNPGIVSMMLTVDFDEALELIGRTDTGLLPGQVHSPTLGNPYTLCWVNDTATTNYTVNGSLVELTFKLSENAEPGTYPITISYDLDNYDIYNCDVELVEFAVVNGGVTYEPDEPTTHTVTFIDPITGEVIAEVEVEHGEAAEAPEAPAHEWYTFTGWDADFSEVIEDITVTAQYTELGDINGDGTVDMRDALQLMRWLIGSDELACDEAEADFNSDGKKDLMDALLLMRHILGTI